MPNYDPDQDRFRDYDRRPEYQPLPGSRVVLTGSVEAWTCRECQQMNALRVPRCNNCGKLKPLTADDAIIRAAILEVLDDGNEGDQWEFDECAPPSRNCVVRKGEAELNRLEFARRVIEVRDRMMFGDDPPLAAITATDCPLHGQVDPAHRCRDFDGIHSGDSSFASAMSDLQVRPLKRNED